MGESLEALEERMAALRRVVMDAAHDGDHEAVKQARLELRELDAAWQAALDAETEAASGQLGGLPRPMGPIPVREQVHQALAILGAPATPKLISDVHDAFFTSPITGKLASLRRDEERSFKAQGYSRPYYICAAITHDRLNAAWGLLAISDWPVERRVYGPLAPRVNFLLQAVRIDEQIQRMQAAGHAPSESAWRLLRRFASNIPGAYVAYRPADPAQTIEASQAESLIHAEADNLIRSETVARLRDLPDVDQLFGLRRQSSTEHLRQVK